MQRAATPSPIAPSPTTQAWAGGAALTPPPPSRIGTHYRARSHCRFVRPFNRSIPDSLRASVPLFLKRRCNRTLNPDNPKSQGRGPHGTAAAPASGRAVRPRSSISRSAMTPIIGRQCCRCWLSRCVCSLREAEGVSASALHLSTVPQHSTSALYLSTLPQRCTSALLRSLRGRRPPCARSRA